MCISSIFDVQAGCNLRVSSTDSNTIALPAAALGNTLSSIGVPDVAAGNGANINGNTLASNFRALIGDGPAGSGASGNTNTNVNTNTGNGSIVARSSNSGKISKEEHESVESVDDNTSVVDHTVKARIYDGVGGTGVNGSGASGNQNSNVNTNTSNGGIIT